MVSFSKATACEALRVADICLQMVQAAADKLESIATTDGNADLADHAKELSEAVTGAEDVVSSARSAFCGG